MKRERARVVVCGAVQGVGFRPFVYRLARQLGLDGWVQNSTQGLVIEVEGSRKTVEQFLRRLAAQPPSRAVIHSTEVMWLAATGHQGFALRDSETSGQKTTWVLPDIATCRDCIDEIFDPLDRRYRYPFTNCTHCGPRFTIIEALPYDRPNTAMRRFVMCPDCAREYHDPGDRRFHAQPNACPRCGPQLALLDGNGAVLSRSDAALCMGAEVVRNGHILALKGIGGFQLIVNAHDEAAVARLRSRKRREEKPLAIMVPSLEAARKLCRISHREEQLLRSPAAPIVLLKQQSASREQSSAIAPSVSPGNPILGVMLPYTPVHHLLLHELGLSVVATSGNVSDEPICTDEAEALVRLKGVADFFLMNDRPIVRHADDSVLRVVCGREMILRRARGFAPLPFRVKETSPATLAVGAHLKNTVALGVGNHVFLSQHIGDLTAGPAWWTFRRVEDDLQRLFGVTPDVVAYDLHPEYLSTKHAAQMPAQHCPVQHHWAHVLACMADNEIEPPVLGVAWDGTGYGADGTIWGGEFLLARGGMFERVAHLRTFRLPGGDAAIREPRRTALGVLYSLWGDSALEHVDLAPIASFTETERTLLAQMLARGFNAPFTSSMGRLFDAVAALLDFRQRASYEGQAAMELEFAIGSGDGKHTAYSFELPEGSPHVLDWHPVITAVIDDLRDGVSPGIISARFHETLAEMIVAVAEMTGERKVVLTGGCFQNAHLTERCVQRLREAGFQPFWHHRIPTNDGGIALGQAVAAQYFHKAQAATAEPFALTSNTEPLCV